MEGGGCAPPVAAQGPPRQQHGLVQDRVEGPAQHQATPEAVGRQASWDRGKSMIGGVGVAGTGDIGSTGGAGSMDLSIPESPGLQKMKTDSQNMALSETVSLCM